MNLKELSASLGLSQTTVSRALNGYPEVSAATRDRVQRAAEQFNYAPSTQAKALATGTAQAIGHVLPLTTKHEMVNPIFGDFISGAGEVYSRNGYEMTISIVDANDDEDRVYRSLQSRRAVDGVVVHGPKMDDPRIAMLTEIGLPFVVHGRASGITEPYTWLDVNNRRSFDRAASFLMDLGHKRIALINGLEDMDFAFRRRAGYEAALQRRNITPDPTIMASAEMTENFGYVTAKAFLAQDNPPTAILVASMISAIGVRRAIARAGKVMGKDVSVVTHDDNLSYLQNAGDIPIFTATRSAVRDAGSQVAEMLLAKIANPDLIADNRLLETELIIGQSTGPAP